MYALVEDNQIKKIITNPIPMVINDVQYPAKIFQLWSKEELNAIGIYEVITDTTNQKDQKYYINTDEQFSYANDQVTRSWGVATPKEYADKNATDENGNELDPVVVIKGLKSHLIDELKLKVSSELSKTDWYVTRKTEKSIDIPSEISNHRDNIRTKQADMEEQILNAEDTPALETLYKYVNVGTEENPIYERPLGELPKLES
tara:strand:+ start:512 stop:1120 length:609 start_codon:yes stop_codon:yes gene_type:complete